MTRLPPSEIFPPASEADEDGLLAIGGRLDVDWLLDAYAHGIFPWPVDPEYPMTWFSPDPRAILSWDEFHISRRLRRTCRSRPFRITCDKAFAEIVQHCARADEKDSEGDEDGGTWITPEMIEAYTALHAAGHAHSVEAWNGDQLVGGVYGVAVGGLFAAESMFHLERDASKIALVCLMHHLRKCGFQLVDVQVTTPITEAFGAREISREEYLDRLADAMEADAAFSPDISIPKLD